MNILVVSKKSLLFFVITKQIVYQKRNSHVFWLLLNVHAENRLKLL